MPTHSENALGFRETKAHPKLIYGIYGVCAIIALNLPIDWYWQIVSFVLMTIAVGFVRMVLRPKLREIIALLAYFAAAYLVGFGLETMFMGIIETAADNRIWPGIGLIVLGIVALPLIASVAFNEWLLAIPFCIIGLLMNIHGLWPSPNLFAPLEPIEYGALAARASVYGGALMLLLGLGHGIHSRMNPGLGGVLCFLLFAGTVLLSWFLPISWYWKIAAFFGNS